MDLVRSWLGQALRATGAAVVIPVASLVALSLTGIGGAGLSGFGGLSQIVSGPEAAGNARVTGGSDAQIGEAVQQLAAVEPTDSVAGTEGGGGSGTGDQGSGGGGGGRNGGGGGGGGGNPPGGGDRPADPPTDPDTPTTDPPEGPPPPEEPGLVESIGEDVNEVTSGTPVGPTIEEAVDGLMETCGQLGCP